MPKDKKILNPPTPPLLKGDLGADKPSRFVVDLKKELVEAKEAEKKEKKKVKWEEMYEKFSEFNVKEYFKDKKANVKNKPRTPSLRSGHSASSFRVNIPLITNLTTMAFWVRGKKETLKVQLTQPVSFNKEKVKKTVSSLIKNSQPIDYSQKTFRPSIWQSIHLLFHITGEARNAYLIYYEKLDRLFIFSTLKFFFKLLYKIGEISYNFFYITGWLFVFLVRLFYFSFLEILKLFFSSMKIMAAGLKPLKSDFGLIFNKIINPLYHPLLKRGNYNFWSWQSLLGGNLPKWPPADRGRVLAARDSAGTKKSPLYKGDVRGFRKFLKSPAPPFTGGELRNPPIPLLIKGAELAEIEKELKSDFKIGGAEKKKESKKFKINALMPRPGILILKPTLVFAAVLLILILPFKAYTYYKSLGLDELKIKVLGASIDAVNTLKSAGEEASGFNFKEANNNFSQAAAKFLEAQNELKSVNDFLFTLARVAPDKDLRLAGQSKNILSAGEIVSSLGSNLSLAVASLFNSESGNINDIINNFTPHPECPDSNVEDEWYIKRSDNAKCLEHKFVGAGFILYGEKALSDAGQLKAVLDSINPDDLPLGYKEQFIGAKSKILFLENGLLEFTDLARDMQKFLGMSENKRYLLVFQNNSEMRATGGFIGSYALVDFQGGKIKNIEAPAGGSYNTEAGLKDLIAAPEPLHLVNPLWHFWDANWWPDWPKSAKKLAWFYEHSDGPTVDGVIGLTPIVVERLLQIIGPIDMTEKYGAIITEENFYETVQNFSEQKDTNKPKEIIGDMFAEILEELPRKLNKENLAVLAKAIENSLSEKHILFYFTDDELEQKIKKYGWDGGLRHTLWDYLAVINTNIAGGKSDRKIRETISHQAEVMADGSIVDAIEIKREHTGDKFQSFSGVRNVDWMRVYVPLGSKLLEADGFQKPDEIYFEKPEASWQNDEEVSREESSAITEEGSGTKIYTEDGKTVFANWSMVDPGQTALIRLKYVLPFKLTAPSSYKLPEKIMEALNPSSKAVVPYALLVQKQLGSIGSAIKSELILPSTMQIVWHYPESAETQADGWQVEDVLSIDKYWAAVINIKN